MYSDHGRREITSLLFISLLVKNIITSHTLDVVLHGRYSKLHRDLSDILKYSYIYIVPRCIKNKAHLRRRQMDVDSNSRMDPRHCCRDVLTGYRWHRVHAHIFHIVWQPTGHLQNLQKIACFVFPGYFENERTAIRQVKVSLYNFRTIFAINL